MIRQLRRRMTIMVILVLVLVSAGIVLAIHLSNERSIAAQAETTLSALSEQSGSRPSLPPGAENTGENDETPPPKSDGDESDSDSRNVSPPPKPEGEENDPGSLGGSPPPKPEGDDGEPPDPPGGRRPGSPGQPPEIRNARDVAAMGLSNSYTIILKDDGSVDSWTSDRKDLYTDTQVSAMAESVLADDRDSGRIGTQFYRRITNSGQTRLIVLDARLEYLSASNMLHSTILVAAAACLLLSMLAWLLIRQMVQPVEDAFIRQKRFVSDASHELKTPLAVISANAEVLEQEIGENEYLGYIRSEVKRTDTLVRNLLTLARLDRHETAAEMKTFDLSHALLDVTLPFESTVFEAGKNLDIQIPEGISCIGNEEMIKQLAVILLSNALKYSDPKGRIVISLKTRGRQREISVFNTGEAIDPEDRERIFDRFYRADPAHQRETGGHGLGLAIAQSIVNTHRGKITVQSHEGEGNTFTVLLPN